MGYIFHDIPNHATTFLTPFLGGGHQHESKPAVGEGQHGGGHSLYQVGANVKSEIWCSIDITLISSQKHLYIKQNQIRFRNSFFQWKFNSFFLRYSNISDFCVWTYDDILTFSWIKNKIWKTRVYSLFVILNTMLLYMETPNLTMTLT